MDQKTKRTLMAGILLPSEKPLGSKRRSRFTGKWQSRWTVIVVLALALALLLNVF